MVFRDDLTRILSHIFEYKNFEDYCLNGLQVEGKDEISKIVFGVSFNLHLLKEAVNRDADAIIVHHGIFGKNFFELKGHLKEKIKILLDKNISLFGIHLPMDTHPVMGHSILLLSSIGAEQIKPFELGFMGDNEKKCSLNDILDIFHVMLHPNDFQSHPFENKVFNLESKNGFTILKNGPDIPRKIAVITGGAAGLYEKAIELGVDTFICGEIKEKVPSLSYETKTNFVDLGHYYSEKPGVLALKKHIQETCSVDTLFVEIPNPV
jgi:dinuclear metal center YbgI/SA1388 family protein